MKPALLLAALPLAAVAALVTTPAHAGGLHIDLGFIFGGRSCTPPPVVVERQVVVSRPVIVEQPVCQRVVSVPACECREPVRSKVVVIERPVIVRSHAHEDRWHRHEVAYRPSRGCR